MTISGKSILVTGANGFLGASVAAAFAKAGCRVIAVHRAGSDLSRLDALCNSAEKIVLADDYSNLPDIMANAKPDLIAHVAAAQDGGDDEKAVRNLIATNILFSTLLVTAARQHNVNYFINTGTSWQNYNQADYDPVNLYAATKQAFEDILAYYTAMGLQAVTLRLFDTYGPNDPRAKITNLLKRVAASGETLAMSPGGQQFDLVHVDDVSSAYVQAARLLFDGAIESNSVFALSSGTPVPLKEFTVRFERALNVKCNIEWGGREYRPREVMVPWNKGRALPGWQPKVSLEEGLKTL